MNQSANSYVLRPIFSADFHSVVPDKHRKLIHPYAKEALVVAQQTGHTSGTGPSVAAVDKQDEEVIWRLATAGGDNTIRVSQQSRVKLWPSLGFNSTAGPAYGGQTLSTLIGRANSWLCRVDRCGKLHPGRISSSQSLAAANCPLPITARLRGYLQSTAGPKLNTSQHSRSILQS